MALYRPRAGRTPAMQRDTLVEIIVVAAALVGIVALIILVVWELS
jgi:hypothetical protein